MCIIAYVPKKKSLSDEVLKNMFTNNPDGAGLMWQNANGTVGYSKGYMDFESLKQAFSKLDTNIDRAIHCRIATSGVISGACCHPFPVTNDLKVMAQTENKRHAKTVLMHNGMISFCTPELGIKAPYSDTMLFTRDYVYPLENQLNKLAIQVLMEQSIHSRLLVFGEDLKAPIMLGKWDCVDGVYFSNSTYKAVKWSKADSYGCYDYSKYYSDVPSMDLLFTFPYTDENNAYDQLIAIFEELNDQGCYPDEYSAEETLTLDDDKNATVVINVIKLPTTRKLLDKYTYFELVDKKS